MIIIGYSEATFANKHDFKSQLGRVILVCYYSRSAMPIVFNRYKSRRVSRSLLSAEVIAFADVFEDALALESQSERAMKRSVPVHQMRL